MSILFEGQWQTEPVQDRGLGVSHPMQGGIYVIGPQKFIQPVIRVVVADQQDLFDVMGDGGSSINCGAVA